MRQQVEWHARDMARNPAQWPERRFSQDRSGFRSSRFHSPCGPFIIDICCITPVNLLKASPGNRSNHAACAGGRVAALIDRGHNGRRKQHRHDDPV